MDDEVMKFQIESTVRNHFEKERRLKGKGIKVNIMKVIVFTQKKSGNISEIPTRVKRKKAHYRTSTKDYLLSN